MRSRELTVAGAFEFTPTVFADERGVFASAFQEPAFVETMGHRLFDVAQVSYARSRRGVVRGVHFTRTPPGAAKYVCCVRGRALDIVTDLRTGSPSFGRQDSVLLDQNDFRAVYFPVGVGHAYVALEDDTVMCYLLSLSYRPENELALFPLDPELGLRIPDGIEPVLSARDRDAPTLAEATAAGLLPEYRRCREIDVAISMSGSQP